MGYNPEESYDTLEHLPMLPEEELEALEEQCYGLTGENNKYEPEFYEWLAEDPSGGQTYEELLNFSNPDAAEVNSEYLKSDLDDMLDIFEDTKEAAAEHKAQLDRVGETEIDDEGNEVVEGGEEEVEEITNINDAIEAKLGRYVPGIYLKVFLDENAEAHKALTESLGKDTDALAKFEASLETHETRTNEFITMKLKENVPQFGDVTTENLDAADILAFNKENQEAYKMLFHWASQGGMTFQMHAETFWAWYKDVKTETEEGEKPKSKPAPAPKKGPRSAPPSKEEADKYKEGVVDHAPSGGGESDVDGSPEGGEKKGGELLQEFTVKFKDKQEENSTRIEDLVVDPEATPYATSDKYKGKVYKYNKEKDSYFNVNDSNDRLKIYDGDIIKLYSGAPGEGGTEGGVEGGTEAAPEAVSEDLRTQFDTVKGLFDEWLETVKAYAKTDHETKKDKKAAFAQLQLDFNHIKRGPYAEFLENANQYEAGSEEQGRGVITTAVYGGLKTEIDAYNAKLGKWAATMSKHMDNIGIAKLGRFDELQELLGVAPKVEPEYNDGGRVKMKDFGLGISYNKLEAEKSASKSKVKSIDFTGASSVTIMKPFMSGKLVITVEGLPQGKIVMKGRSWDELALSMEEDYPVGRVEMFGAAGEKAKDAAPADDADKAEDADGVEEPKTDVVDTVADIDEEEVEERISYVLTKATLKTELKLKDTGGVTNLKGPLKEEKVKVSGGPNAKFEDAYTFEYRGAEVTVEGDLSRAYIKKMDGKRVREIHQLVDRSLDIVLNTLKA